MDERPARPGQHGTSRHVLSEYGRRLREKQRLRAQYFISEAHLRRTFGHAVRRPGPTGENLWARSHPMPVFAAAREEPAVAVPAYLEVRRDLLAARVVRDARRHEVPVTCDEQLVIEYYAR
jgi:ribosomal protein S4